MRKVDASTIKNLIAYEGEPVMSLYIPTHRYPTPPNIKEDQTRFKNLIREGCLQWSQQADPKAVEAIHNQLFEYLDDLGFWQGMLETLVIFATLEGFEMFNLPMETEERVHVGSRYDVTPLLLVESVNKPAYVFILAMHESKLYKVDMYGGERVDIEFPKSIEEALNIDEMYSGSNTIRNGRQAGANSIAGSPHGQGDANEAGREERLMYLRLLDSKIRTHKDFDATLPFVIAATDTEYGDFKAVSQIKNIVDVHIPGNHTATTAPELHRLVSTLLFEHVTQKHIAQEVEKVDELKSLKKASSDLGDIAIAADEGRVSTLLVPMIDMTTDSVRDGEAPEPLIRFSERFDKALFNIIMKVARNGGAIIGVERGALPRLATVAAVFRY